MQVVQKVNVKAGMNWNRNFKIADKMLSFSSQQVQFKTTFYVPPVVLISVHHQYNGPFIHHILPENNIITAWVEVRHIMSLIWFKFLQLADPCFCWE